MANPLKKSNVRKGHGFMDEPPDLLLATYNMNLTAIKDCLEVNPDLIQQVDKFGCNAMHLCVAGGSPRVKEIMTFFINETNIDLLHENEDGVSPLELAFSLNDQGAVELLEEPTRRQLLARYPDPKPTLKPT